MHTAYDKNIPINFMLVSHGALQLGQFVGNVKTFNKANETRNH